MTEDTYHFGDEGEVHIGARVLKNVTSASVSFSGERGRSERFSAGDTSVGGKSGADPELTGEVELELYDEDGVTGDLDHFLRNTATGKNQTIKIRPLGTGEGLKELVLTGKQGMELTAKSKGFPITTDAEAADGSMTWTGYFAQEPAWTVQPAP